MARSRPARSGRRSVYLVRMDCLGRTYLSQQGLRAHVSILSLRNVSACHESLDDTYSRFSTFLKVNGDVQRELLSTWPRDGRDVCIGISSIVPLWELLGREGS